MENVSADDLMRLAVNAVNAGDMGAMDRITSYISGMGQKDSDYMDVWDMLDRARAKMTSSPSLGKGIIGGAIKYQRG